MKKQNSILFLFTLLISMVCTKSFAHDISVANADGKIIYYNYTNNRTELEVSSSYAYSGNIVIPESVTYNGTTYSVTSIGNSAFFGCSNLTSITIPNSVMSIGEYAFNDCGGLTAVHISDLNAWCNIQFSDNPLSYAHHLYLNGQEIRNLLIPNSVTSIGASAFNGCSGLTSVTFSNSVTSIGSSAFTNCSGLTSVTIPNSVTSIGSSAFYGCCSLTSISIPNSVTSIGVRAFEGCSSLTSVALSKSMTSIESQTFYGCCSLTSISIPNSVTSIGDNAFNSCI